MLGAILPQRLVAQVALVIAVLNDLIGVLDLAAGTCALIHSLRLVRSLTSLSSMATNLLRFGGDVSFHMA